MKRRILYIFIAMLLASCTQDVVVDKQSAQSANNRIYASIDTTEDAEDGGVDTRVELNSKKQTVWTAEDQILTFSNDGFYLWQFDGKTGDRAGSFIFVSNYGKPDASIVNYDKYYAVYLADLTYYAYSDKSPIFFTTLPSIQSYKAHSYGLNTNAMIGSSSDGENYTFKNLFGYLRLSLTGSKMVDNIEIKGRNNEEIAGQFYFDTTTALKYYDKGAYSITLDCGNGVQLTDMPTEFYITLPPVTLSKGITVTINFTDGTVFTKSTSKSIIIERNAIQPMKSFDTGGEVDWQTITIRHSGDRIYSPYFYGSSALSGFIYWGDDYMSNVNTTTSYIYDDGETSHTITTKTIEASVIEFDSCLGVSEIDLTNF